MKTRYDPALLATVAKMYYRQELKQEDIASRINTSRASISMMLTEAKQQGIVQILVRDPSEEHRELASDIEKQTNLSRCVVVPTSIRDPEVLRRIVAGRGVEVFNDEVGSADTVGIAWGRTCYSFMSLYTPREGIHSVEVVPMVGGSNRNLKRYQPNDMVRGFADTLHGTPHLIHAPALPSSLEDYNLYMQSSSMKSTFAAWRRLSLAVVSVGVPPVDREFDGSELSRHRSRWIGNPAGLPLGDICARYYDIHGNFVSDDIGERTIAIPVENLRSIPRVIAIAAGTKKAFSLVGALNTGIINVLVIDEQTARALIEALDLYHNYTSDLVKRIAQLYDIGESETT